MTNRTPLIVAIVLLLLPMMYVGSYLALVVPSPDIQRIVGKRATRRGALPTWGVARPYRYGGELIGMMFWPLEQIDRRVRPAAWERLDTNAVLPGTRN